MGQTVEKTNVKLIQGGASEEPVSAERTGYPEGHPQVGGSAFEAVERSALLSMDRASMPLTPAEESDLDNSFSALVGFRDYYLSLDTNERQNVSFEELNFGYQATLAAMFRSFQREGHA